MSMDGDGRSKGKGMADSPVRRILVPVDFSSCSGDALRFAHSLAGALGASIEVLHVMEPSGTMLDRVADRPSGGDRASAEDLLRDFVAALRPGSVPITERIEDGQPYDRIVSLARDEGFDLIVMGTNGRTGRSHMLAGSVAESVVRTSPRPVLTVRER
jgi:nucleotide-binding universal stress UspA family protein